MALDPYLYRSGSRGILNFRRQVPPHLRDIVGKREILKSLGSADRQAAMPKYLEMRRKSDEIFALAEQRLATGGPTAKEVPITPAVGPAALAALAERHFETVLSVERERRESITLRARANPNAFWKGEIIPIPQDLKFKQLAAAGPSAMFTARLSTAE